MPLVCVGRADKAVGAVADADAGLAAPGWAQLQLASKSIPYGGVSMLIFVLGAATSSAEVIE